MIITRAITTNRLLDYNVVENRPNQSMMTEKDIA